MSDPSIPAAQNEIMPAELAWAAIQKTPASTPAPLALKAAPDAVAADAGLSITTGRWGR